MAWTCALALGAVEDYAPVVALAEKTASADLHNANALASILYRAGRHQELIERLTEVERQLTEAGDAARSSPAYARFFLAIAHERLGHHDQAAEWLKKAVQESDKTNGSRPQDRCGSRAGPSPGQGRGGRVPRSCHRS